MNAENIAAEEVKIVHIMSTEGITPLVNMSSTKNKLYNIETHISIEDLLLSRPDQHIKIHAIGGHKQGSTCLTNNPPVRIYLFTRSAKASVLDST